MTLTAYAAALAGALLLPAGMLALAGCSAATTRAAETTALQVAETACEMFLPMKVPNYGPEAVLGCKGADALIAGILSAVTPAPVVGQSMVLAWHPLRVNGRIAYLVQTSAEVASAAQARLDAQTVRAK